MSIRNVEKIHENRIGSILSSLGWVQRGSLRNEDGTRRRPYYPDPDKWNRIKPLISNIPVEQSSISPIEMKGFGGSNVTVLRPGFEIGDSDEY